MTGNNPNVYLYNINTYATFGEILSICSKDIERKRNSDNQSRTISLFYKFAKMTGQNPNHILSISLHILKLVKFCPIFLEILGENEIRT